MTVASVTFDVGMRDRYYRLLVGFFLPGDLRDSWMRALQSYLINHERLYTPKESIFLWFSLRSDQFPAAEREAKATARDAC